MQGKLDFDTVSAVWGICRTLGTLLMSLRGTAKCKPTPPPTPLRTEVTVPNTRKLFSRSASVLGRPRQIASLANSTAAQLITLRRLASSLLFDVGGGGLTRCDRRGFVC